MGSSHNVDAWVMELEWLCRVVCGKSTRRKMWRVIQCASIYFFWQERNCRLHGGSFSTTSMILHLIFSTIQARALSWSEDVSEFFQVFFFVCCLAWPRAVRFFFFFFFPFLCLAFLGLDALVGSSRGCLFVLLALFLGSSLWFGVVWFALAFLCLICLVFSSFLCLCLRPRLQGPLVVV